MKGGGKRVTAQCLRRESATTNGDKPPAPEETAAGHRARFTRSHPPRGSGRGDTGFALPAVIAVGAAVAALTGTWFESALTESRRTRALSDRLIAFHAADAALAACTARLLRGSASYLPERDAHAEPDAWRHEPALTLAEAFAPFADWPPAVQPPRCLIEAWRGAGPDDARAYLVTARGVGTHGSSVVWLQSQVAIRDGRIVAQRWRRVAALH